MGTDAKILLPRHTRIDAVAEAMGILSGLPKHKQELGSTNGAWAVRVPHSKATGNETIPEMAQIIMTAPEGSTLVDGKKSHMAYWHWQGDDVGDYWHVSVRSTAYWIAIGRALVAFFGGKMDYNDCDNVSWNYRRDCPRKRNNPNDDKPWQDFQEAIFNLKPLTKADIQACQKWAAYK